MNEVSKISISIDNSGNGIISISSDGMSASIWSRINSSILFHNFEHKSTGSSIRLSWPDTLTIIREFGTKSSQAAYNFRFLPSNEAKQKLNDFQNRYVLFEILEK